jgi:pimeloyl-ACP methyl ester carboxylesterase
MPVVEGAGVQLAYVERGAGPPALVLHDLAADALAVAPLAERLAAQGLRVIAYDRRGYGASGAPEPYHGTTVQEQAEDAGALLEALAAVPAVLVGEGFGALIALELLVRRPEIARGAVLVEPPLLAYVPEATEVLAAQRQGLEESLRDSGPAAAVARWLGPGADPGRVQRAGASAPGFFADYAGLATWIPARRQLRALAVPIGVVTGPATPAHLVRAADELAALVPAAARRADGDAVAAAAGL